MTKILLHLSSNKSPFLMSSDGSKPLGMKLRIKVQFVTISKNVAFRKWRTWRSMKNMKKLKTMHNFKIYFSFYQPKSLEKSTYHLMMMLKHHDTTQVDWYKTTQERCIQEVTNDVVEKQMELDYERSHQELEEIQCWITLSP